MAKGIKTGGRKTGTPNKATASVKEAAQQYTTQAIEALAAILADESQPAQARIAAANSLLDRGHGKARQALELEPSDAVNRITLEFVESNGNGEPA